MSVQNRLETEKQELTTNLLMIEKKLNEEKSIRGRNYLLILQI